MRQLKIAAIIIFSLLAISLIGLMTFCITTGNGLSFLSEGYKGKAELAQEFAVLTKDTDSIELDLSHNAMDVYVYVGEGDKIVYKEYLEKGWSDSELSKVSKEGNSLVVRGKNSISDFHIFSMGNQYAEIYIPADYGKIITIQTSSGNVFLEGNQAFGEMVMINTSSGDVQLEEVTADRFSISTSSGNVFADVMQGEREISTSSGDVKLLGGDGNTTCSTSSGNMYLSEAAGSVDLSCNSGDITVLGTVGTGRIGTSSGNVNMEAGKLTGDLEINTSSGDVKLQLTKEVPFEFVVNTSSGDINTFFDDELSYNKDQNGAKGMIGTDASFNVKIQTSSGNVKVYE